MKILIADGKAKCEDERGVEVHVRENFVFIGGVDGCVW